MRRDAPAALVVGSGAICVAGRLARLASCQHISSFTHRTRRKARCPIGTERHISPGRWVSARAFVCIMLVCKCVSEPAPSCHHGSRREMQRR
eukprot:89597-Prymnesium_polylepis.1